MCVLLSTPKPTDRTLNVCRHPDNENTLCPSDEVGVPAFADFCPHYIRKLNLSPTRRFPEWLNLQSRFRDVAVHCIGLQQVAHCFNICTDLLFPNFGEQIFMQRVSTRSHSNSQTRRGPLFHKLERHSKGPTFRNSIRVACTLEISQKAQYSYQVFVDKLIRCHQRLRSLDVLARLCNHLSIVRLGSLKKHIVVEADDTLEMTVRLVKYLLLRCCMLSVGFFGFIFDWHVRSRERTIYRRGTITGQYGWLQTTTMLGSWARFLSFLHLLFERMVWPDGGDNGEGLAPDSRWFGYLTSHCFQCKLFNWRNYCSVGHNCLSNFWHQIQTGGELNDSVLERLHDPGHVLEDQKYLTFEGFAKCFFNERLNNIDVSWLRCVDHHSLSEFSYAIIELFHCVLPKNFDDFVNTPTWYLIIATGTTRTRSISLVRPW